MKPSAYRTVLVLATFVVSTIQATAASLTLSDGTQIEGEIFRATGDSISITDKAGKRVKYTLSQFKSASKKAIKNWKQANPTKADVYTKWDHQPALVTSVLPRLPEQLRETSFKGTASIELVLDSSGKVMHASVKESSHPALAASSMEAVKSWTFQPAQVNGKPVKSKLRVPFNFKNEIPEEKREWIKEENAFNTLMGQTS